MRMMSAAAIAVVMLVCAVPAAYSLYGTSYVNDGNTVTTGINGEISLTLYEPGNSEFLFGTCYRYILGHYVMKHSIHNEFYPTHALSINTGSGQNQFIYTNSSPSEMNVTAYVTVTVTPAVAVENARIDFNLDGNTSPDKAYFTDGVANVEAVRGLTYDDVSGTYRFAGNASLDLVFGTDLTFDSDEKPSLLFEMTMVCGEDSVYYSQTHVLCS